MPKIKKVEEIDFDDEDAVLAEVAKELDIDPDELEIEEDSGFSSFGAGTVYEISISGGHKTWMVVKDYDQQEALAVAVVTQDLEDEPENFNKSFIESHIDKDKLRDELESGVNDMITDDLEEMSASEFWRAYELEGFDHPEDDNGDELEEPEQSHIDELAEQMTKDRLRDPMEYLEEIYGDDAAKKAIEISGIDIEAAADEAVDTDGAVHFLSSYDGNDHETPNGLVYWRRD